jgi:hypothetical protein
MADEAQPQVFFDGPCYALVVGISKYKYATDPQKRTYGEYAGFLNLSVARQDAEAFAKFLIDYGFIGDNVKVLVDEGATRPEIYKELAKLGKKCKQSGVPSPLVIVYFSGHGWVADDEHFLVPHDGEIDNLTGTALPNAEFRRRLSELPTNRLVVFVDACHSGAIAQEKAKGGAALHYDVEALEALGEGEGRYLIASCRATQSSWELDENSIFTAHLLELLRCTTDDIEDEKIDVFTIFQTLKKKVKDTALQKYGQEQEPTSRMTDATGIILAFNPRAREKRQQREQKARDFLEAVQPLIKGSKSPNKTTIIEILSGYVEEGMKLEAPEDLFTLFDENVRRWDGIGGETPKSCATLLIRKFDAPPTNAIKPKESNAQERRKQADAAPAPSVPAAAVTAPAVTPLAAASGAEEKRSFAPDDVEQILEPLRVKKLWALKPLSDLSEKLRRPVSESDVYDIIQDLRKTSIPKEVVAVLENRLSEAWERAQPVQQQTLANVFLEKSNV